MKKNTTKWKPGNTKYFAGVSFSFARYSTTLHVQMKRITPLQYALTRRQ